RSTPRKSNARWARPRHSVHTPERIGIPKHFLRPRERPSWSPPAPAPPATPRRGYSRAPSAAREPRRNAPAPDGARRCTVLRGFGWCWTGAAGWGRVVPQGCPGATASERATGKAGGGDGISRLFRHETHLHCTHVAPETTCDVVG